MPARKKAKLDRNDGTGLPESSSAPIGSSLSTSREQRAAQAAVIGDTSEAAQLADVSNPLAETPASPVLHRETTTPQSASARPARSAKTKARAKLSDAAAALSPTPEAAASTISTPQPETQASSASLAVSDTLAKTSQRAQQSAKSKGKATLEDEDEDYNEFAAVEDLDTLNSPPEFGTIRSPTKTPVRSRRSAEGKSKARLDEDDFDDDNVQGKDPDLEIFSQDGPLNTLNRIQLKTNKPRSLRPLWLQGVYQPPFFGIPTSDIISSVANKDFTSQPTNLPDKRSVQGALPWPKDGHVSTRLDPEAYPLIKRTLLKHWFGQVGWIPNEGVYDWGWYPGKEFGSKPNRERSEWAQNARQQILQGASPTNEILAEGLHPGWPFVQSWLDMKNGKMQTMTSKEARPFLHDTITPQRANLRHPTTVMKLSVPELTMRNRMKKSTLTDTPKPAKKLGRSKKDASGTDTEEAAEQVDDDAADDDENAIAALDANHEPINLKDPKFANIPNLGFEEKGPICGDVLHICVGAPDQETSVEIAKGTSKRLDSLGVLANDAHILNAGGHVYALDWAPIPIHLNTGKEYFVVSAAASKAPVTCIGQKQPSPTPANLQIWSLSPDLHASEKSSRGGAKLEMMICHQVGAAFKLAWCPIGHDFAGADNSESKKEDRMRRLGLLAGCFADGSLSVFSVPHPESVRINAKKMNVAEVLHIRLDPILRLEHPQQVATSLAWAGGEMLAFGGSQGWLGVWNVGQIFRQHHRPSSPPPPDYVVRAHRSAITDLAFVLFPPIDANGIAQTSSLPTTLFTVSLDGWTAVVDLHRSSSTSIERSRTVHYACAFSPFSGGSLVHEHADGSVAHYSLRPEEMLRSRQISLTPSRVVALSTSPFHPMLAMGTAHGELKVANTLRTLRRSQRNHLPIYQMIVNRSTGQLLFRHQLQPEIASNAESKRFHIAQWHPCLAVTAVKWNPNLARCRLLLSGTAAGVVKIDHVKPPYESAS